MFIILFTVQKVVNFDLVLLVSLLIFWNDQWMQHFYNETFVFVLISPQKVGLLSLIQSSQKKTTLLLIMWSFKHIQAFKVSKHPEHLKPSLLVLCEYSQFDRLQPYLLSIHLHGLGCLSLHSLFLQYPLIRLSLQIELEWTKQNLFPYLQ